MPLYQFKCDSCGYEVELVLHVDEAADMPCAKCMYEGTLRKQITAPGCLIFDTPTWLDQSVRDAVQDPADQKRHPIETRKDLDQWTKSKDLVPVG